MEKIRVSYEIMGERREFKGNELHLIENGCAMGHDAPDVNEVFDNREQAEKVFAEKYKQTDVLIRNDISSVIEYSLEAITYEVDENGYEEQINQETLMSSEINLTAWATYMHDTTKRVEDVEQSGFLRFEDAKNWLDEQYYAHDPLEWTEIHSAIH